MALRNMFGNIWWKEGIGEAEGGRWMVDAGYWILDTGCWILDAGFWMFALPKPNGTGWMLEEAKMEMISDIRLQIAEVTDDGG